MPWRGVRPRTPDHSDQRSQRAESVFESTDPASGWFVEITTEAGVRYRVHEFTTAGESTFTVTQGGEVEYRFNYNAYKRGRAPGTNIVLHTGDTIIVPD